MRISNGVKKSSLSKKVLAKLQSGQVKMRSKRYFILKAVLVALITLLVALFTLYLVSFVIFSLRASGLWFLPGFGFPAMRIFFSSLPWLLILITVILIIVLELFVKRFAFAYRRPILYSILGIIIFTILGSFIITKTQLHPELFIKAREGKLPMMGGFYRGFGIPKLANVHHGIVSDITDNGFYLETPKGEILTIIATSTIRFSLGKDIKKDDRVVVLGERDDSTVKAFSVRRIDDAQFDIFERGPHRPMRWNK